MNILCRLSHAKRDESGVGSLANTTDTVLGILQTMDDVSREFERETGRQFYAYSGTRYYSGNRRSPTVLKLPHDLISVTSLTVDDDDNGTYEMTLVADTDYWLGPQANAQKGEPYWEIELNPNGTQLYHWPRHPRAIKIVGLFGYSNETEAAGTTAEALDTSETGVDLTAGHSVEPGDTIWIDSEQMYVTSVSSNTATVVRGINGSTAASHNTSAAVTVRRYPRDVEMVVRERVVGLRWDAQSGHAGQASLTGDPFGASGTTTIRASYARWRQTVDRYRFPGVA